MSNLWGGGVWDRVFAIKSKAEAVALAKELEAKGEMTEELAEQITRIGMRFADVIDINKAREVK
jgi:hypothetical protein